MISDTPTTLLLAITTVLLCTSFILRRVRKHWPLWIRGVSRTVIFVTLTLLVKRLLGSPLAPQYSAPSATQGFWEHVVEAGWWVVASRAAVGIARLFVVLEDRPRETRIVSDLVAGAIYVAATLAVINFAFGVPVRGLVATSGVIAIVLGLALQSTLSDVFSGVAVGIERPYKAGDLLWVEGGIEGQVVQISWRSTQIATGHGNIAIVPNSVIAKSRPVNRSAPTPKRSDSITVSLDRNAIPERCVSVLGAALLACGLPVEEPPPSVVCTGVQGDGVSYELSFSVGSSDDLRAARSEVYSQVHRHLRHAGIALAVTGLPAPSAVPVPTIEQLLEWSDLFGVLEPDDRALFANRFTLQELQIGDTLIREGDPPEALYVIVGGTAKISRREAGADRVLYRISSARALAPSA